MDNPYRPPEQPPVQVVGESFAMRRLASAAIFFLSALPLASMLALEIMERVAFGDGPVFYRVIRTGEGWTWIGWAMSILLFAAGLTSILRRRWSIPLFGLYLVGLILASIEIGWNAARVVGIVMVAACLAYMIALNKRDGLR
ncbi:MAG: hypothetical protein E6Q50_05920 [Lysobacter sp.]|nr:MAG: hypothetical protein E6Q50_05920 [Lysobacter sp.]